MLLYLRLSHGVLRCWQPTRLLCRLGRVTGQGWWMDEDSRRPQRLSLTPANQGKWSDCRKTAEEGCDLRCTWHKVKLLHRKATHRTVTAASRWPVATWLGWFSFLLTEDVGMRYPQILYDVYCMLEENGCCSFNQWKAADLRHSYPKRLKAWQCLGVAM